MRTITIPVDDLYMHKVSSLAEYSAKRRAAEHKAKAAPECRCDICRPEAKVFKSACELFGLTVTTMRDLFMKPPADPKVVREVSPARFPRTLVTEPAG